MTVEEILKRYAKACEDTTMELEPGYQRVYRHKNQPLRDSLRNEYIQLLPLNKRVAVLLHSKLCRYDHTCGCTFYHEIHGIEDNWGGHEHRDYLEKSDKLLDLLRESGIPEDNLYTMVSDITNILG